MTFLFIKIKFPIFIPNHFLKRTIAYIIQQGRIRNK